MPQNDQLLVSNKVHLELEEYSPNKEFWEYELAATTRQQPNRKLLGIPYALMLYNMMGKKKRGMFKNLTEPPALFSQKDIEEDELLIRNRLQEWGFFEVSIRHDTIYKSDKKRAVEYSVRVGKRRRIGKVDFAPSSSSEIDSVIRQAHEASRYIKPRDYYKLDNLASDRDYIASVMRDNGYYYFQPENIFYKADTTQSATLVNLELNVQAGTNHSSLKAYEVGKIRIHYNEVLPSGVKNVEWHEDGLSFFGSNPFVRPKVIKKRLFISQGDKYSATKHSASQLYLDQLGIIDQSRIVFSPNDSLVNTLDCDVFLNRAKRYNIGVVTDVSYKSINFWGPGVRLSFLDNDAFRRSVRFIAFTEGNIAFQTEDVEYDRLGDIAYEITSGIQFDIPVMLSWLGKDLKRRSKSSTVISLQHNFYHRPRYYQLYNWDFTMGYRWQPNPQTTLRWNFVDMEYYFLDETTSRFDEELETKPVFARSFENRLLFGASFQVEKSNMTTPDRGYRWITKLESMGNLVNLGLMAQEDGNWEQRPSREFLTIPYAQYVLLETDFSKRIPLNHRSTFAYRIAVGVGFALGNSDVLPYTKQFFVGGVSSVRAFKLRSFGPGGTSLEDKSFFTEQTGDIKFEANVEYRKKLDDLFEIALFLDAGNVWTSKYDASRPNANFDFERVLPELALGTGFGLRLHTGVVIVRVDLGFPIRDPGLPEGDRWTLSSTNFKEREWKPRLNFTVGYPF